MAQNFTENMTVNATVVAVDDLKEDINFADVLLLLVNFSAISANAVIIFVVLKCKLNSPTNIFVVNYAILDILHLLTSPSIYRWYRHVHEIYHYFDTQSAYGIFTIGFEIGIGILLLFLLLKDNLKAIAKHYKYMILAVWVIVVFMFTVPDIFFTEIMNKHGYCGTVFFIVYLTLLLTYIIKITVRCVRKDAIPNDDQKLRYNLVLCYLCLWFQFDINLLLAMYYWEWTEGRFVFVVMFLILELNSIINLIIIIRYDRRFKISLYELFTKKLNSTDENTNFISDKDYFSEIQL